MHMLTDNCLEIAIALVRMEHNANVARMNLTDCERKPIRADLKAPSIVIVRPLASHSCFGLSKRES
jgi:hypothetical protein